MTTTEIQYTTTGDSRRAQMSRYHRKPEPRDLSKGAKNNDIAQLKSTERVNLSQVGTDFHSKFTIGMEVEKNSLARGARKEYALFCGFETDSSCGYEAVTNILPLLPAGQWRNKVYNMFVEAKRVIEDSYSPSDSRCGGHITIAVEGMTGEELLEKVRVNAGIILALFRKRLSNHYCNNNITMLPFRDNDDAIGSTQTRYQVALAKGNVLEFRIPSRFQSVKQMMRRYELMYELLDFSINNPNGSHSAFLKKVEPIVRSMYAGDTEKTKEIMTLAKSFRKMILTNKVNRDVINFVDPRRRLNAERFYDRDLMTNGYH